MQTNIVANVITFDTYQNQRIHQYTLTNQNGVRVGVLDLGATLHELSIPTPAGSRKNLIMSFPYSADYRSSDTYAGMAVGRTAGRIRDGRIQLNGTPFQLPQNEGQTTLHGGPNGFSAQLWSGQIVLKDDQPTIVCTLLQQAKDDGYPGNMEASITYALSADNTLSITFAATSDEDTVFNPTQHTYFNLGDTQDIRDHILTVSAPDYLELDADNCPTGRFLPVADTTFDFQQGQYLGQAIANLAATPHQGLDDIFHVPDNTAIAHLLDPATDRKVTIHSDRNALVVYTANAFIETMPFVSGAGHPYQAVALEAQNLPDTTKHPNFGSELLPANTPVRHHLSYHLDF